MATAIRIPQDRKRIVVKDRVQEITCKVVDREGIPILSEIVDSKFVDVERVTYVD